MYTGYKQVSLSEDDMIHLYSNPTDNMFDCVANEYIILRDGENNVIDRMKWDGEKYQPLSFRNIDNKYTGKIKPRNIQQELSFDLLQNSDITIKVITGTFGSGKTMLMVSTALGLVESGKFDKIVYVRNNVEVKDSRPIGYIPGDTFDKLLPWAMPFADHAGGVDGVELLMKQNKLEVQHLGFIRGRDIKNSIVICSEAENLTKQHVQLLIGRIGEKSALWLDGDFRQVDAKVFEENSGLGKCIDALKGNRLFGYVHLEKSERSETAALADLLD